MGMFHIICLSLAILYLTPKGVESHGRMLDPPQRSSMWRFGFGTPTNYDDNGQNCGGMKNQWEDHGGKCGICGAPWQEPHENETGVIYALGIISRHYNVGDQIPVTIEITANHKGYFEFKLCPNNDNSTRVTQDCLDQYVLEVVDTDSDFKTRYYPGTESKKYSMVLRLPKDVTCTQCLLQWRYHTGNSWGCDANKKCCLGCGEKQEEFYGCADVSIAGAVSTDNVTDASPKTATEQTTTTDIKPTEIAHITKLDSTGWEYYSIGIHKSPAMDIWCQNNCPVGCCPTDLCAFGKKTNCQAVTMFKNLQCLNDWCKDNCPLGTCPGEICICN